ncbi:recombinase family protein [Ornithinibacillus xuwenensis]|uniref:Recombinase family protein n=1 Tax=Ornithinibacillus xuwenensis TaxID=3144668 RepID=A0ABU9XBR3_9BACI
MLNQQRSELTKYNDYKYIVYARVSSGKDSQKDSVPNQIDICRYWLEQNNFEWEDDSVLIDEDKSGTLFIEREAMQLILEKARNREIKMVAFKSIHRLARDLKDALEIKEVLLGHGVRVVTIEEGYDSQVEGKNDMKFEMYSMFAAQLPKTISVSISSALAAKVRRGEHIGKVPYGYERIDKKLVVKADEAEIIRKIYNWYNEGYGFKAITNMLNEGLESGEFLPPRSKGKWQVTTIQRIIKNPTFCGILILNQYTTIKVDGRKKQIRNPEEKWTIFEDHHPGIVSRDVWEKANSKPVINKKKKISPWNEFRGLLKCGNCGSNMVIMQSWRKKKDGTKTRWRYLKCSAYRRGGTSMCQNHVPITYEDFREFLVGILKEKGEEMVFDFNNVYGTHKKQQILKLEKSIEEYQNKSKELLDIRLNRLIDNNEFEEKRAELDKLIKSAQDKLFIYNKEEISNKTVKNVKEAFDEIDRKDQDIFHALQVIIDYITIHIDGKIDIHYNFDINK